MVLNSHPSLKETPWNDWPIVLEEIGARADDRSADIWSTVATVPVDIAQPLTRMAHCARIPQRKRLALLFLLMRLCWEELPGSAWNDWLRRTLDSSYESSFSVGLSSFVREEVA